MSVFRNAAGMLFTSGVSIPIGLATSVVLARFLAVEERGLYSVTMAFATLAVVLARMGWPTASIFRLRRSQSPPDEVLGVGMLVMGLVSVVLVLGCIFLEPLITHQLLDDAPSQIFYYAVGMMPFLLLNALFSGVARGIDRFRYQNWASFAFTAGSLLAVAYVLILQGGHLVDLLRTLLVLQIAITTALGIAVARVTGISLRFDWEETAESLKFGLKSHLQGLAGLLHERIDVFMIALLLKDPEQVAYYAIAVGVMDRLKLAPRALSAATFPHVAGLGVRQASKFVCAVSRQSTAIVCGTALALALVGPMLIPWIYGDPYRASIAPFAILLPGTALLTIYRVLGRFFAGINRQQINIVTQVLSVAVNIALNWILIPRYGILGAAYASLASYALEALLIIVVFRRVTGHTLRELFVFGAEDADAYRRRMLPLLRQLRLTR